MTAKIPTTGGSTRIQKYGNPGGFWAVVYLCVNKTKWETEEGEPYVYAL